MAKSAARKTEAPQSTAQQLDGIIKSYRDIMRKDNRLPMLTCIMFLKY